MGGTTQLPLPAQTRDGSDHPRAARRAGLLAAGREQTAHFGAVAAQCLTGTPHKRVRRLAYAFLRGYPHAVELAEWIMVREAVLDDMLAAAWRTWSWLVDGEREVRAVLGAGERVAPACRLMIAFEHP